MSVCLSISVARVVVPSKDLPREISSPSKQYRQARQMEGARFPTGSEPVLVVRVCNTLYIIIIIIRVIHNK